ncbi:Recombinase [Actinacidiphila yanglinensis]|uniref:Recombinase n=2 Tax=Actinacidiphila yanglinensis TaxID=310779 RepID=A0A1H6CD57_9ACTN|nr:Recombinase [Actinacidiphila yanglinensis]
MGLDRPADGEPETLADVYIRRSKKSEDLATLRGHLRQVHAYLAREDVAIRHVWLEQKSASKVHVRRDEFDNACAAVLAGRSKTLAAWKTDRFDRRGMGQVTPLLDELEKRRGRLVSTSEGLDSSRGGRVVFALLSDRAMEESRDISKRVLIGLESHRVIGRVPGGPLPFGLQRVGNGRIAPHPDEYPTARKIAELLLEGLGGTTAAHRVNAEGLSTRSGRHWSANAIARMAQSPLWAGLVPFRERHIDEFGQPIDKWGTWKADVLLDASGTPVSCGTGVVTLTEWYAIKAQFSSRTFRGAKGMHGAKRPGKLLTGIMKCPHCQVGMVSGGESYRCRTHLEGGPTACRGVRTKASRVDFVVGEMWVTHVSALEPGGEALYEIARRWLSYQDPEKKARHRHTEAALKDSHRRAEELDAAYYVHGRMSAERYAQLADALAAQVALLGEDLRELERQADLTPLLDAELLTEAWATAELDDKRMLLRSVVDELVLLPSAKQGDRTPIENRLRVRWVGGPK